MAISSTLGKILIVDDDRHITDLLQYNLGSEGYDVEVECVAAKALERDLSLTRLVIADAYNQKFTGMQLLEELKSGANTQHIGIIICTESDRESDLIAALDAGADDYVVKPFSLREFVARVRSVLRRHPLRNQPLPGLTLTFRDLEVDVASGKVTSDGMLITLSKTELAILTMLMKNFHNYVTRSEIYREVWKDAEGSNERIVDTNISRLRKKLGPTGAYIQNRTGLGYIFTDK